MTSNSTTSQLRRGIARAIYITAGCATLAGITLICFDFGGASWPLCLFGAIILALTANSIDNPVRRLQDSQTPAPGTTKQL